MPLCTFCKSKPKSLFTVDNFHYFLCSNCITLFLHPIPNEKEIKSFYKRTFEYSAGLVEEKRIRSRSKKIIEKLKRLHPQGKTLLDIGSGYGYFLDEARKNNFDITGLEPSRKLYRQSLKRLQMKSIFNWSLEEYSKKYKWKRFDFISAIHVIEHVSDPIQFISDATKLMNRNGVLYIETPNFNSWLAKVEKENYTFLTPPDHIWLFSSRSFRQIFKDFRNSKIEKFSTYSYPEHFMGIIKSKLKVKSEKLKMRSEKLDLRIDLKLKIKNLRFVGKWVKYIALDKIIAPILTPLLNIGGYGSILELYIKKK